MQAENPSNAAKVRQAINVFLPAHLAEHILGRFLSADRDSSEGGTVAALPDCCIGGAEEHESGDEQIHHEYSNAAKQASRMYSSLGAPGLMEITGRPAAATTCPSQPLI